MCPCALAASSSLSILPELHRPDTVHTLERGGGGLERDWQVTHVSGFISLARVSTSSGTNWNREVNTAREMLVQESSI